MYESGELAQAVGAEPGGGETAVEAPVEGAAPLQIENRLQQ
jgi:hypothetical protein